MAEGWARTLIPDRVEPLSAGTHPGTLNPLAVRVMRESGVDISGQRSKSIDEFIDHPPDLVVTVCHEAHEACPVFPGATRVVHVGFEDPPRLAASARTEEEALPHYRRVRDEIRLFILTLGDRLDLTAHPGGE